MEQSRTRERKILQEGVLGIDCPIASCFASDPYFAARYTEPRLPEL